MSPIYIPPQLVPIIRQKVRNIADIQEQLRAYDKAQQDLVGANTARFDANNINRKEVLYPPPTPQQDIALGDITSLAGIGEEESKQAESTMTQPQQEIALGDRDPREKSKAELMIELRRFGERGSFEKKTKEQLQNLARELGINIMR
jgi:hypothetical protein